MTIVTHRDKKTFNVAVMKYKNSLLYVQRQTNRVLRSCRNFVRAYIDDVVIFSKFLQEHLENLRSVFDFMLINNISINLKSAFLKYFSMSLLKQHVNSLDLFIEKEKN